ncbi:MAG TPA: RDD family protein [Hanamia sp.]|nr:RDD family protein [Hanamia sp.]
MENLLADIQLQAKKAKPGIRYIVTAIEYFVFLSTYNLFRPIHNDNTTWGLSFIAIWIFYFPLMEAVTGQTLGKKLAKIKVVKKDFSKINFLQAFVRRLFDPVDLVSQQCLTIVDVAYIESDAMSRARRGC